MNYKITLPLIFVSFLLIFFIPSYVFAASFVAIENLSDTPDPFSPNGDGIQDQTIISATISASGFEAHRSLWLTWTLSIRNSHGKLVRRSFRHTKIENDSQIEISQIWDGRDKKANFVSNGQYTYKMEARVRWRKAEPRAGEITVVGVPEPELVISNVTDLPDPFSPNKDGIDDTTAISATISVSGFDEHVDKKGRLLLVWKLFIRDSHGKLIRSFFQIQKVVNDSKIAISRVWNGENYRSKVVEDGTYLYEFTARIKKIKAKPKGGDVTVKTKSYLSVSVSPDLWDIGEALPNSVLTMGEGEKITVLNDGELAVTYSLNLINPPGWQASQGEVGINTYILNAAFSGNVENITWSESLHALSTVSVVCSDIRFAGDQTGVKVMPGEERTLWLQFKSPNATSITEEQKIEVIINAESP